MPRQFFNRLCTLTQGVTQLVLLFGFLLCCQTVNAQQGTVAPDTWKDNLYFYAEVDARGAVITPLAEQTSQRWMTLLLNVDRDYTNGLEGYDAMVSNRDGKVYLYVWDKEKKDWKEDRTVKVKVSDRKLMLTLTRKSVGIRNGADFDFKWIDNVRMDSREILDFLRDGDAAPNGRFNYRYKHRN